MRINIKNFKNIEDIQLNLDSNLNFIYGISGSGKTSIGEALKIKGDEVGIPEEMRRVGSAEAPEIICNSSNINFEVFNEKSIENFIFEKEKDGLYNVLFKPTEELVDIEQEIKEFNNREDINQIRNNLAGYQHAFNELNSKLKFTFNNDNTIRNNVNVQQLKNINTIENKLYSNKQMSWLKDGLSYINDGECSFCKNAVSKNRINEIEKLIELKPDIIEKIENETTYLKSLNFQTRTLNTLNDSENFLNEYAKSNKINKNIIHILKIINNNFVEIEDVTLITIEGETEQFYLDKYNISLIDKFASINSEKEAYIRKCREYKGRYVSHISSGLSNINSKLDLLGINYKIDKVDRLDKSEEYKFIHKDSSGSNDFSKLLSTGEKNIVSLILFLIINEDNNVIIDDPASSFDEYRRMQILKLINDLRKDLEKTTIVFSHDQIFLKFLLNSQNERGPAYNEWDTFIFENTTGQEIKRINSQDIDTLNNHIINKIKESNLYEEKIINLRLYFELNKEGNKEIYSYLSGIMHMENKSYEEGKNIIDEFFETEEYEEYIKNNERTLYDENILLQRLKEYNAAFELEKFNGINLRNIYNDVSNFEKIIIKREQIRNREQIKIFNDVVHFNYGLVHMINPYKYNYQIKEIYSMIEGEE